MHRSPPNLPPTQSPGRSGYLLFLVEIRNTHVRQTGSDINFHHCSFVKIALMSNISKKKVTDTTMGLMEVEYETTHGLLIGNMTYDLR